jgi:hypothetical protein
MQTDIIGTSIGIAGIVISLIVSYLSNRKNLRLKEPSWSIRSNNLVEGFSNKVENLKVIYNDICVENLTISKILFWNDGKETINRQDYETINKLRVECSHNAKLLDAKIISSNNLSSQITIIKSDQNNCAFILFDYLDEKQGAVIQVVHTGTSSKDLQIVGDIKGVKVIKKIETTPSWIKWVSKLTIPKKAGKIYGIGMIVAGVVYFGIGIIGLLALILSLFSPATKPALSSNTIVNTIVFFLGGLFMFSMGFSAVRVIAPKGLEVFQEE